MITIFTIGVAGKKAEEFFPLLAQNGVERVVDIRLHNTSQLAGYAKRDDLRYFLRVIINAAYVYVPELAPSGDLFEGMRSKKVNWDVFTREYLDLLAERRVEDILEPHMMDKACLLCSEASPRQCHRRLAAEYLQGKWGAAVINHL